MYQLADLRWLAAQFKKAEMLPDRLVAKPDKGGEVPQKYKS